MTNEIKEIIEYLKDDSMFIADEDGTRKELTLDESKLLLNYISDLEDTIINKNNCIEAYNCILENRDKRIDKATDYLLDKYVRGLLGDNEVNNVVKILRGDE